MATYEMAFPTRIVFGAGALAELPARLSELGAAAPLVVTDPGVVKAGLHEPVQETLSRAGFSPALFSGVQENPLEEDCLRAAEAYRRAGADSVVGLGGGSAMDAAKLVRLLSTHDGPLAQYDDLAGGGQRVVRPLPPMIAIPTTAGTGSEVGRSAVVTIGERPGRKIVVFAPALIPSVALCDPELTVGLPARITAATGMDAFVHCLEAYCARGTHPLADAIAIDGLARAARALPVAVAEPGNLAARGEMMTAALMGAVAFQKGLGACHSLAHALTPTCGVAHGLANAILIQHVARFNAPAAPERIEKVAAAIGGRGTAAEQIAALVGSLGIPTRVRDVGLVEARIPEVAARALADGCHAQNPRPVALADFEALLRAAW